VHVLGHVRVHGSAIPVVGRLLERRRPRNIVLTGTALLASGMSVFVYGITRHHVDVSILLAALAVFGVGSACLMTPVSWAAVHTLSSSEVAHSSTLFNVNHNAAASIGAAVMSVALTSRFNGNDLSHAYAGVFVVAIVLVAATAVPAWLLPGSAAPSVELMHVDPQLA
jgi:MFS transporter, DHA2 family, multidrug resistance protein